MGTNSKTNPSRAWARTAALAVCILVLVSGCAGGPKAVPAVETSSASVASALEQHYQQWRGTQYRRGGLSKNGIDCSGFTHLTYRDLFGVSLPRTAASQSKVGREVNKNYLQPGDLVLFKTGKSGHVGIYIRDGRFVHASTSKGVTLSSLYSQYWSQHYWKGKRVEGLSTR